MMSENGSDLDTFPKVLARNVSKFGNSPAYREKEYGIWQTWTWSEANEEIMNLANRSLAHLSFGEKKRVAFASELIKRKFKSSGKKYDLGWGSKVKTPNGELFLRPHCRAISITC